MTNEEKVDLFHNVLINNLKPMLKHKLILIMGCALALAGIAGTARAVTQMHVPSVPSHGMRQISRIPRLPMHRPLQAIMDGLCEHFADNRFFIPFHICELPPPEPICGDGVMNQESEQCDGEDGVGEHQTCTDQCVLEDVPYCGDSVVNQGTEQCDGSAGVGEHQVCNDQCVLEEIPYCGDGMMNQESEQCDGEDGVGEGQICTDQCILEEVPPAGEARVVINEVLANPSEAQGLDANEWIELYNAGTASADLTGWSVKDSTGSPDVLPGSVILAPGAFAIISPGADVGTFWSFPEGTQVIQSSIGNGLTNSGGDAVMLMNAENAVVDQASYGANTEAFDPGADLPTDGKSISRSPNGADTDTAADWSLLDTPTPGM